MKIPVIGTVYQSFFSSFKKYTFFIVNNINILQGKEKIFVSIGGFYGTTEAIKMKFGMRTPCIKKSIKARTTGKAK